METNIPQSRPNPWLAIWLHPRRTIRQIVDFDSGHHVLLLASLLGIMRSLDQATQKNLGDTFSLPLILIICVIAGAIGGIVSLYVGGGVLYYTGGWLGGQAEYKELRAALA